MLNLKEIFIIVPLLAFLGCGGSDSTNQDSEATETIATMCQSDSIGRETNMGEKIENNKTYITYKYENNTLNLMHYNSSFNCEEGSIISFKSNVKPNKITITESQTLPLGGVKCLCLYDLTIKIENIQPDVYEIDFNDGSIDDEILFTIDLEEKITGSVSYDRLYYPYNL